jgi:hypothetical protein
VYNYRTFSLIFNEPSSNDDLCSQVCGTLFCIWGVSFSDLGQEVAVLTRVYSGFATSTQKCKNSSNVRLSLHPFPFSSVM